LHTINFVNTVNLMSNLLNAKHKNLQAPKNQQYSQSSEKGLYVREDDQDWGSAGMNDIQHEDSE